MRQKIYKVFIGAMLAASSILPSPAQNSTKAPSAQNLLAQARAAIASEVRLNQIKSLSAAYSIRRLLPNGEQLTGEAQLDFLPPDRFAKSETWTLPGNIGQVISSTLLNGDQTWSDAHATNSKIPVMRDSESEKEGLALLQRMRKENALSLLQLLLAAPSDVFAEFIEVGEAQAEDGRADVVDAKGANGFVVRLFFDKGSHRLLLMSFQEPAPQRIPLSHSKSDKSLSQPAPRTEAAKGPVIEVQFRFSDYRAEDGINVPHLITKESNGRIVEERNLKSLKINPSFKPDHFEIRRKS